MTRSDLVDVAAVVEHLGRLSAAGVGYRRVAELSGVHQSMIRRWKYGHTTHASPDHAARVLAVTAEGRARPWLPGDGTQRRLRALTRLGWPVYELAPRIGWTETNLVQLMHRPGVQRATAAKVMRLYDELSMRRPADSYPVRRARLRAVRYMWFPPLAWDDEMIDDPDALPCLLPPVEPVDRDLELHVQHLVAGHQVESTPVAVREIGRRMPDSSIAAIAKAAQTTRERVTYLGIRRRPRQEVAS